MKESMNLSALCIKRPAFTVVISLVLMILGIISFMNLPVRWIPNINPPVVSVVTTYPGANSRLIEHDVTQVIEGAMSGIDGIESLSSTSRHGESTVTINFKLGVNLDSRVADIRSAIERVRNALPREVDTPLVVKANMNSSPILYLAFSDSKRTERELSDYVKNFVLPTFETTDGVGSIEMHGDQLSVLRIALDPAKMAGANTTSDEVVQLLHDQNASVPSGQIRSRDRVYSIITDSLLKTPEQFNELILRDDHNQITRLKDVGTAKIDIENKDSVFRINGQPAVAMGIIPQVMANPLDVEKNVKLALSTIQHTLPGSMKAEIIYNQADYIRASIHSVYESFLEAIIFVWLVILAFLCSLRATWIPIVTIPVCLISTFTILYLFGFSINTITLMAFVLAIGLVVDDAIVMLENIQRHIEQGMSAYSAALLGSREMIFPIIAMTLTLAAVYAPIAFTPGLLGVLFKEFTFTLAGAVLISGLIALTLSPMMCSRLLAQRSTENRYQQWLAIKLNLCQSHYRKILLYVLTKKKHVLGALLAFVLLGAGIYQYLPVELAPAEDMNRIYVYVSAPRASSSAYTDHFTKELEAHYQTIPDIISYFSASSRHSTATAFQALSLKPRSERSQSMDQIIADISAKNNAIAGARINVFTPPPPLAEFTGDQGDNMGLVIMTTSDYRKLQHASQHLTDLLKNEPGFVYVDNRLKWDSEQFQVDIDRNRAADLKVSVPDIMNTLSTLIAGKKIGKANDMDVMMQIDELSLSNPNIIQQIYVRSSNGNMVPLSQLVNLTISTAPDVYRRYSRLRSDTISINLAPNVNMTDAIKRMEQLAKENLPDDMKYTFSGEAKSFLESNGRTLLTFALSLIFIYLVLVAQFESFIDPLVIMLTVPFAVIGAFITLKLLGGSLNIYSNIGLITLVGLIAKHGILITEFANKLRLSGKSIQDAVIEAAILRLRPILMTTAAMILGALPLALAYGPGAESRQQVGFVITGGLLFGTFFSLIVVPIAYSYLASLRKLPLTNQEPSHASAI